MTALPDVRVVNALITAPDWCERVVRRALEDAFAEAESDYWRRRARDLEHVGTLWADGAALAARRHALFLDAQRLSVDLAAVTA